MRSSLRSILAPWLACAAVLGLLLAPVTGGVAHCSHSPAGETAHEEMAHGHPVPQDSHSHGDSHDGCPHCPPADCLAHTTCALAGGECDQPPAPRRLDASPARLLAGAQPSAASVSNVPPTPPPQPLA